jgi:hypothetical protein
VAPTTGPPRAWEMAATRSASVQFCLFGGRRDGVRSGQGTGGVSGVVALLRGEREGEGLTGLHPPCKLGAARQAQVVIARKVH